MELQGVSEIKYIISGTTGVSEIKYIISGTIGGIRNKVVSQLFI